VSRSKSGADQNYAEARVVDRHGHEVGRVLFDVADGHERVMGKMDGSGRWRLWVDELPSQLHWTCPRCPGEDLRADPTVLVPMLRERFPDPHRGRFDYRVG